MIANLRSCPFCGKKETSLDHNHLTVGDTTSTYYFVFCYYCEAYGPAETSEEAAITAWNKRAPDIELEAQLDPAR